MEKQGRGYIRLISIVLAVLLGSYGLLHLLQGSKQQPYTLCTAAYCEVGDGETVSGFVVREETVLYSTAQAVQPLFPEGEWVCAGACVALGYGEQTSRLTVSQGGYFSTCTDGFETLLTPRSLQSLTPGEFGAMLPLIPQSVPGAYGRLISGQRWYFVVCLPEARRQDCSIGERLRVTLDRDLVFSMEILSLSPTERGSFLLILSSTEQIGQISALRFVGGQVEFSRQKGLLVPKEAIHVQQGAAGVFVRQGVRVRWKPITVLCHREDCLLVEEDLSTVRNLWPGDEILVTQIELYDGMVLQ